MFSEGILSVCHSIYWNKPHILATLSFYALTITSFPWLTLSTLPKVQISTSLNMINYAERLSCTATPPKKDSKNVCFLMSQMRCVIYDDTLFIFHRTKVLALPPSRRWFVVVVVFVFYLVDSLRQGFHLCGCIKIYLCLTNYNNDKLL